MSFAIRIQVGGLLGLAALAVGTVACSSGGGDDGRTTDAANAGAGGSTGGASATTGGASTAAGGSDTGNTGGTVSGDGGTPADSGVAATGGASTSGYPPSVCNGRGDLYEQGMTKTGDLGTGMTVSLVDANPAPPQLCDDCNQWTLMIRDGDGNPVEGARLKLDPRMPDHGHGTPIVAEVEDMGGGEYLVDSISLFMKGFWTIAVTVTPAEGEADDVLFKFCVPPESS